MVQGEEVINLIISSVFIIYLIFLIRWQSNSLRTFWFVGVVLIFCSQIFTVAEGAYFTSLLNILEHLFFTLAIIFFLISIVKKEV